MDRKQENMLKQGHCTSEPCSSNGVCCDGLPDHLPKRQLTACVFSDEAERTDDRPLEHFARLVREKRV